MRELSIYIHIPFCVRKCLYCDFLSGPAHEGEMEDYVNHLLREIKEQSIFYGDHRVVSIFFGGGTPSLLPARDVERILEHVREGFVLAADVETTIECNPGTAAAEKLDNYITCGINRLSIGLQSADDGELGRIGRIHNYSDFLKTYWLAREAGFRNINVDLMAGLPGQSLASYKKTLQRVTALSPEHISAYSLILEEGTPLYVNQESYVFPDEDEDRQMYRLTGEYLEEAGFHRYEISNYAREGKECRHNKVYWRRGDYVGLGMGASSMVNNVRWKNPEKHADYAAYVDRLAAQAADSRRSCEKENGIAETAAERTACLRAAGAKEMLELTREEQMEEFMFLGLRLMEGVDGRRFERMFSEPLEKVYEKPVAKFLSAGLLQREGERFFLTSRGIDVSNAVFAEFLF